MEFIKRFGHVQFEKHNRDFEGFKRMDGFMSKDNTIKNLTPFNISSLFRRDEEMEDGFEPIGDEFGDNFVDGIA